MSNVPVTNELNQLINFTERVGTRPADKNSMKRAKDILLRSMAVWPVVAEEEGGLKEALFPYTVEVSLIPMLIGSVLGTSLWGILSSIVSGEAPALNPAAHVLSTIVGFCTELFGTLALGKVVELAAPSFGLRKSWVLSTRVIVYAFTPYSLAYLVTWIPVLGTLVGLATFVWSLVLALRGFKIVLAQKVTPPQVTKVDKAERSDPAERELTSV